MPIDTRGRVQNRAADHPSGHVKWSPPLTEKYKCHARHGSPKCHRERAGHQQVAGGSLARVLGSTKGNCDIWIFENIGVFRTNGFLETWVFENRWVFEIR